MEEWEFYIAVLSDEDGLYWSDTIWTGDRDLIAIRYQAEVDSADARRSNPGVLTIHGPFECGPALTKES